MPGVALNTIDPCLTGFGGPFDLAETSAYRAWRDAKLSGYPASPEALVVSVRDAHRLSPIERAALLERCRKANMAICASRRLGDRALVAALGAQLGLRRLDANPGADGDRITPLRVTREGLRRGYIPYTDRALNWHTDGYYNATERRVRAFILYCVVNAQYGGANAFLDHEVAYILLRETDPDYVAALMHPEAMTVPPNAGEGAAREARTGPVFSVDRETGALHMRYTARTRSITWRADPLTRRAVECLRALLEEGASPYVFRHRLRPGEGVICNNVLHCRGAFTDDHRAERRRLLYRARYYDRIAPTAEAGEHALAERDFAAAPGSRFV
ncbi:MAG: TauD/TfdA family dioxygenase [Gammaproteobacteria bacterium]|nr:TauD/TfdA family dioxygenase [Gammaproteobacteria bacterium]NIR81664.1 TauD/TfdA family dioxygenase [Gammaproteobacteria bacterium]NIU02698.1 TauD/TfdA family dioxygenase [Gammaproteobacteria bacterium]NIV73400.1 taurine catabolism dioxygenase TauD [Gammaproteobacteria bacterium]NIX83973.1 taurine catabolism dioxygenase TauD [Gammaproteobacteria bacterium]